MMAGSADTGQGEGGGGEACRFTVFVGCGDEATPAG